MGAQPSQFIVGFNIMQSVALRGLEICPSLNLFHFEENYSGVFWTIKLILTWIRKLECSFVPSLTEVFSCYLLLNIVQHYCMEHSCSS